MKIQESVQATYRFIAHPLQQATACQRAVAIIANIVLCALGIGLFLHLYHWRAHCFTCRTPADAPGPAQAVNDVAIDILSPPSVQGQEMPNSIPPVAPPAATPMQEVVLDLPDERELSLPGLLPQEENRPSLISPSSSGLLKPGPLGPGNSHPNLRGVRNSSQITPRPLGRGSSEIALPVLEQPPFAVLPQAETDLASTPLTEPEVFLSPPAPSSIPPQDHSTSPTEVPEESKSDTESPKAGSSRSSSTISEEYKISDLEDDFVEVNPADEWKKACEQGLQIALEQRELCLFGLMWHLRELSIQKHQEFEQGTFVIKDAGDVIHDFLVQYPKAYKRWSSHFTRTRESCYGIDIEGLPTQKRTIHFGKLKTLTGENYTFIKPENYGMGDIVSNVCHGVDYAWTRFFQPTGKDIRKERLPPLLHINYLEIAKTLNLITDENTDLINNYGIAAMVKILTPHQKNEAVNKFLKEIEKNYDHLDIRKGNEVILDNVYYIAPVASNDLD
ncbi:MAG: hypothetical protein KGJ02_04825 [Verrucomicrobiota bacterium]|nr:hypothetical protein [Verrucomicrobiota bacterium]